MQTVCQKFKMKNWEKKFMNQIQPLESTKPEFPASTMKSIVFNPL